MCGLVIDFEQKGTQAESRQLMDGAGAENREESDNVLEPDAASKTAKRMG